MPRGEAGGDVSSGVPFARSADEERGVEGPADGDEGDGVEGPGQGIDFLPRGVPPSYCPRVNILQSVVYRVSSSAK
jgi:hypothetical protein